LLLIKEKTTNIKFCFSSSESAISDNVFHFLAALSVPSELHSESQAGTGLCSSIEGRLVFNETLFLFLITVLVHGVMREFRAHNKKWNDLYLRVTS
jgi:hypothetical protein